MESEAGACYGVHAIDSIVENVNELTFIIIPPIYPGKYNFPFIHFIPQGTG